MLMFDPTEFGVCVEERVVFKEGQAWSSFSVNTMKKW